MKRIKLGIFLKWRLERFLGELEKATDEPFDSTISAKIDALLILLEK